MIRTFARAALATMVLVPAAAQSQSVVGEWESVERSPGGVGEVIEFRGDGTARQTAAAMGDATYRLDGEWLLSTWTDRDTGKSSVLANVVDVEGDELFQKDEEGNLVSRMRRDGPPQGSSPVAGIWCSEDGPGLTTFTELTADGRMFIRLPIRTLDGRYWLSGDQLAVELDGSTRREFQFRVDGDVLTVTPTGGKAREFHRSHSTILKGTR